jgi:hypothetical protein
MTKRHDGISMRFSLLALEGLGVDEWGSRLKPSEFLEPLEFKDLG